MNRLWKNQKGAVTVMVTLLLIPALLVSGSGVDLARIFTAKSIVQDANQMAANAVLTSYDAMLQDLYGLFAVDTEVGNMVSKYINMSIYGTEDGSSSGGGAGEFGLFDGTSCSTTVISGLAIGKTDVLRHQIEEYAKFRAPVAIANNLLNLLDQFDNIKEDAEIVQDKMYIDNKIEELGKKYDELYSIIQKVNTNCDTDYVKIINERLDIIHDQLEAMAVIRADYENQNMHADDMQISKMEEYRLKYENCKKNIKQAINGGATHKWIDGKVVDGVWETGSASREVWRSCSPSLGKLAKSAEDELSTFEDNLDSLVKKCKEADDVKTQLQARLEALDGKVQAGYCSEDMAKAMKEDKSIDTYRKMLKYDIEPMGQAVKNYNGGKISQLKQALQSVCYAKLSGNSASGSEFKLVSANDIDAENYSIDLTINNEGPNKNPKIKDGLASLLAAKSGYKYSVKNMFKHFQDGSFSSTKNGDFYSVLCQARENSKKTKADKTKDNILSLLKSIQDKYKKLSFTPRGATYYKELKEPDPKSKTDEPEGYGQGEWKNTDTFSTDTISALDKIKSLVGTAVNKLLLVTYDTEMFSCYSTSSDKLQKSMADVPMDTDVNYFFQSELEYLYHGNLQSARSNLMAAAGTLLLIRFVCNYLATFTVTEVDSIISDIKAACSWAGPIGAAVGFAVGEGARVAFALGESVLDIVDLINGEKVPFMKNSETWKLSITNLAEDVLPSLTDNSKSKDDEGLLYIDYMRLFLMFLGDNVIADRTKMLIALNVTNKKNHVYEPGVSIHEGDKDHNETKMTAITLFDMNKAYTCFNISTTVNLRFLFLSMSYAQKGVNGVIPPKTLDVTVSDWRGY